MMDAAPPPPKFAIRNLTFSFNGKAALKGVTLDIYPNQITVIFGPSRAGKSVFMRTLNRLNDLIEGTAMQGQVLLDGRDIYAPEEDVVALRRRVGMVFAVPIPLPGSVRENVTYGLKLAGVRDRRRLDEALERSLRAAALWDEVKARLDDSAYALSGGQQQRLCLARVLALEPEVILLDNPTSGLDPISTARVEESLRLLRERYTVVMVPHSIQQAARIADRAAFLLDGELVEVAGGGEMFVRPQDPRTEAYVTGRFG
ncbi:MAG: phosphate ABC transporter ATP-binding protein [Anaerolineae bacterium]